MDSTLALRENVKKLMALKGFSQQKLAKNSGISQRAISNLVANNSLLKSPSVSTAESIARGLGVSLEELLNHDCAAVAPREDDPYADLSYLIRNFMAADSEGRKAKATKKFLGG